MASTSSCGEADDWAGPRMTHADFATRLASRRAAAGNPVLPRNAGDNRTDSKRALLAAIVAVGGRW